MPRYIAFLRGINVGGHTVKMDVLRQQFEDLGLERVSTFIASGNVIFESPDALAGALVFRIEEKLLTALGYEVATFMRTDREVAWIASFDPFPDDGPTQTDSRRYVMFLRERPEPTVVTRVEALSNDADRFCVHDRELYWLRRGSLLDSTVDGPAFAKALGGMLTTSRNLNTVRRLAAKYPPA